MRRLAPIGLILLLAGLGVYLLRSLSQSPAPEKLDEEAPIVVDWPGRVIDEEQAPHVPGDSTLTGTVRRGVDPVSARVEVRAFAETPGVRQRTMDLDSAWLRVAPADGPILYEATADAKGAYLILGLAPGRYEVRATAPDGATGARRVTIRAPRENVRADVVIPGGPCVLRGRALYADGTPFVGHVSAGFEEIWQAPRSQAVRTEDDGRFTIPGLWPGMVRPVARTDGSSLYLGQWLRLPFSGELLIIVDKEYREFAGRVLSEADDRPIAGASLVVGGGGDGFWGAVRGVSGKDGRFRFRVPPTDLQVSVSARGYTPSSFSSASFMKGEKNIRLATAGRLTGTVVSEGEDRPLGGVPVHLIPIDEHDVLNIPRTVSAPDGSFAFADVPDCEVVPFAFGNGWSGRGLEGIEDGDYVPGALTVPPGETRHVIVAVRPAARITGRVEYPAGEVVPGITVAARPGDVHSEDLLSFLSERTVTDADGRFSFDSIVPGHPWLVEAEPGSSCRKTAGPLRGAPGETVEALIAAVPGRSLELTVLLEETGEPVAGAWAHVYLGGGYARSRSGYSDSGGRLRLDSLPDEGLRMYVCHQDYVYSESIFFAPGKLPGRHLVKLARGLPIGGKVVWPDGSPAVGVNVSGEDADKESGRGTLFHTDTDRRGRFRLNGFPPRNLLVDAYFVKDRLLYQSAKVAAKTGETDLLLELGTEDEPAERPLRVLVLDPGGRPVPAAEVYLTSVSTLDSAFLEVIDGRAECLLHPDFVEVTAEVTGARSASGRPLPVGAFVLGPLPVPERELVIRLPRERRISGKIVDAYENPVPGVRVEATVDRDQGFHDGRHRGARTDAAGEFVIGGLGRCTYVVRASLPPGWWGENRVSAEAGTEGILFRIRRGGGAVVRVQDEAGRPVGGARVIVYRMDDNENVRIAERRCDPDGCARFPGLPEQATLMFRVHTSASRRELLTAERCDWHPGDTEVRLRAGKFVSGIVRDEVGDPVPGVVVWGRVGKGARSTRQRAGTDQGGNFHLGPFPEGRVELTVLEKKLWPDESDWGEAVSAGSTGAALRYVPTWTLEVTIGNWPGGMDWALLTEVTSGKTHRAAVGRDGKLDMTGLSRDSRYAVFVHPRRDRRIFYHPGIGQETGRFDGMLVPGETIRGRMLVPEGWKPKEVFVTGIGFSVHAMADPDGSFVVTGVPAGTWTLTASATAPAEESPREVKREVRARTGSIVTVDLR